MTGRADTSVTVSKGASSATASDDFPQPPDGSVLISFIQPRQEES